MSKSALLVIAQKGFQDVELKGTRDGLLAAGFSVTLCSKEAGPCIGKYDGKETATLAMKDAKAGDYNRVAFVGGPGAFALVQDSDALALARAAAATGKPLGAICIAPTILAAAGVLQGKKATVWDDGVGTQIDLLRQSGAVYSGEMVTVDGLLVTGNGPAAAEEFGRVFASIEV